MKNNNFKKEPVPILVLILVASSCIPTLATNTNTLTNNPVSTYILTKEFVFSEPTVVEDSECLYVYMNESDLNMMTPEKPVLPVNLSVMEFPFGTKILNIEYEHSPPEMINLTQQLTLASTSVPDNMKNYKPQNTMDLSLYDDIDIYPVDWISYHLGGGLSDGNHTTFLVLRVYPVRYFPLENQLQFIHQITVNITIKHPVGTSLDEHSVYDLLIITPKRFTNELQPLVCHKNNHGIKTKLITLCEIYEQMFWHGRDSAEKIKYFIKDAVENWGIKYVLLVGGRKGQSFSWHLPVRYSYVVPWEGHEHADYSFISDLYYADIYDSEGNFSSWDSDGDNIFSEWKGSFKEEMDLYPDVYLGRLACRNSIEVKTMVDKITSYEKDKCDDIWFKKMVLVGGDSYNDTYHFVEGELANQEAWEHMPGFTPVKVWASEQDINRKTVKAAMDPGCGFAYFCGHGSTSSWSTHYPPNGTDWCTGFDIDDMIFLRNGDKLPVVVVGGCHNAQFNVTLANIIKGILNSGLHYFSRKPPFGRFWYNEWVPNCWAWWLTSKIDGGAIATIANTGLGTHGIDDSDNNTIPDYLEIYDGWLEIRFFQLYGEEHVDILGENHGETLIEYLHRFLGNEDKVDVKMVQQWELFGDPTLKIGGYE